jgi:3-hydroxyacyl-[acyl-carrier-protein] dehydratase
MYSHHEVRAILPHGHPIQLIDRVPELIDYERVVALKAISGAEPCFAGLDGAPAAAYAYPRSLLLESFCQAGAFLWLASEQRAGRPPSGDLAFAVARDVVFRFDAYPGDVLRHEVRLRQRKGDTAFLTGVSYVDERPVLEVATITTSVLPRAAPEFS